MSARVPVLRLRLLAAIARTMPARFRRRVPSLAGGLSWLVVSPSRRRLLASHQRRLTPEAVGAEIDRRVRAMVASYTRYWIDTLRLPAVSEEESLRAISVEGYHHVEEALAAGRGAILALPHLGGWEWAGRWLAARGVEVVSVVERLEPPEVLDWFTSLRADLGIVVHPAGPDTVGRLRETLDRNGVVCLLSDRDVTGGGYEVEFCGEVTRLPAGPAVLALRTGAPLLPTAVYQVEGDRHLGLVVDPIDTARRDGFRRDTERVMADLSAALEALLSRAPEQWHLFQPNWPTDPGWVAC